MPSALVQPFVISSLEERVAWCRRPYPGHPSGCPNLGRKPGCPPCPPLWDILDKTKPVFAIYNMFAFGIHCATMRQRHPNWTDRQIRCCYYWQVGARKALRGEIREFLLDNRGLKVVGTPEAAGCILSTTMATAGITLQWPPQNLAYQIVLAGTPLRGRAPAAEVRNG